VTRVLIADDHAIVRTGLRTLLRAQPTLELVGEATGGYEALELAEKTRPDILLLDLSMADLDGISVTRESKRRFPEVRVLILTVHEEQALLQEAIRAGASGYILKQAAESELLSAIDVLMRGNMYVDPAMMRDLLRESMEGPASSTSEAVEPLTPRETEVLTYIVRGYTNRQIGEELGISVRTVEGHRANLSSKLGIQSRVDFVRYAREHGLVD
jgi:two-component system, NarL family, response regulator NreC